MFDDLDPGFHKRAWYRHRTQAERIRNAGIPKAVRRQLDRLDKPTSAQQKMMATGIGWVKHSPTTNLGGVALEGEGFLVTGGRQTGKTTGAARMLRQIVADDENKVSGRYTTSTLLCQMFNDAVKHDGVLGDQWVDPYLLDAIEKRFDIVVIDDFGTEPLTDFRIDSLFSLLKYRHAALLPTVIVVSPRLMSKQDFADRYGTDFADFIDGAYFAIECTPSKDM